MEITEEKEIPIEFKWSCQSAKIAKAQNKFIWVGGDKLLFKFISRAIELWISDDIDERSSVFNIEYRIAGTPGDIFIALIYCGYSSDKIKNIIDDSITKNNYNSSKKTEYLEELDVFRKASSIKEKKNVSSGFKWSSDEAVKAKNNNTFLRVNEDNIICSYRPLSRALKSWSTDEQQNEVFNLQYRITGAPLNIMYVLKSYGYSDNEIEYIINDSITKNNYTSNKKIEYLEELKQYRRFKSIEGRISIKEKQNSVIEKREIPNQILRWSIQEFEQAMDEDKFIWISGDSELYLTLPDVIKFWTSDNIKERDVILNFKYRIVGTPEDITSMLEYFCYPITIIKAILKNSITKNNFSKKLLV